MQDGEKKAAVSSDERLFQRRAAADALPDKCYRTSFFVTFVSLPSFGDGVITPTVTWQAAVLMLQQSCCSLCSSRLQHLNDAPDGWMRDPANLSIERSIMNSDGM